MVGRKSAICGIGGMRMRACRGRFSTALIDKTSESRLDIVPQVSDGDYVRLDLYEEVSNVVASTANNTEWTDYHDKVCINHSTSARPSHCRHWRIDVEQ